MKDSPVKPKAPYRNMFSPIAELKGSVPTSKTNIKGVRETIEAVNKP